MKTIEVVIIALLSTVSAIITWYLLFLNTGGSEGPFGPVYTSIFFPPFFALIFLLIRSVLLKR
ncbi:MAG: hypothetical protein R6U17_06355 [Thermoplasmata archaeon]